MLFVGRELWVSQAHKGDNIRRLSRAGTPCIHSHSPPPHMLIRYFCLKEDRPAFSGVGYSHIMPLLPRVQQDLHGQGELTTLAGECSAACLSGALI